MSKTPKKTNTEFIFTKSSRLTLLNINKFQTNNFIYMAVNNLLPMSFEKIFTHVDAIHDHNTRYQVQNTLYVTSATTSVRHHFLKSRSPALWSEVPSGLKSLNDLQMFKKMYKIHLICPSET